MTTAYAEPATDQTPEEIAEEMQAQTLRLRGMLAAAACSPRTQRLAKEFADNFEAGVEIVSKILAELKAERLNLELTQIGDKKRALDAQERDLLAQLQALDLGDEPEPTTEELWERAVRHHQRDARVRTWARNEGLDVKSRGLIRRELVEAWLRAHPDAVTALAQDTPESPRR